MKPVFLNNPDYLLLVPNKYRNDRNKYLLWCKLTQIDTDIWYGLYVHVFVLIGLLHYYERHCLSLLRFFFI